MDYVLRLRYAVFSKGNLSKSKKRDAVFAYEYIVCTMFISSPLDECPMHALNFDNCSCHHQSKVATYCYHRHHVT
jgi:hypothetical protein